jgi:CVNH domain-containing protein
MQLFLIPTILLVQIPLLVSAAPSASAVANATSIMADHFANSCKDFKINKRKFEFTATCQRIDQSAGWITSTMGLSSCYANDNGEINVSTRDLNENPGS